MKTLEVVGGRCHFGASFEEWERSTSDSFEFEFCGALGRTKDMETIGLQAANCC